MSHRDRRSVAIRFLRTATPMGALLKSCVGHSAEAATARATFAAVVYMVQRDAPADLGLTDPGLYARLRARITDLRIGGWVPIDVDFEPVWPVQ